ncbi:MAG: PAS domain-containing sensor histidine kinase, partial [Chloroflexi bacterium]|nr:PAS domain-containing sensor histidine kinase [Chloroflexota bacterium]
MSETSPDTSSDRQGLAGAPGPHDFGIGQLFWRIREAVVVAEPLSGRIVLWNPPAEAIFGYTAAEAALAVRDEFLTVAAHELRSPLTSLKGHVQLAHRRLARGGSAADVASLLETVDALADRAARLIDVLLDMSRLSAGTLALDLAPVPVCELVNRIVAVERDAEPARRIDVAMPPGEAIVTADAIRIEQVLLNPIGNARKYSPPEAPIHIQVARTGTGVAISVRDAGIGIPPDDQPHIFDRF